MKQYDAIIIGSGLGGLVTAAILSKEGFEVCVLEQHHVIGGCLQSFKRKGHIFDTGIHYVGSLSEGQVMYQYFKYLGIYDKLNLRKLDESGFDRIILDNKEYKHAMGHENFYETLCQQFPEERDGLKSFCKRVQEIGSGISVDIMKEGKISNLRIEDRFISAYDEIRNHVNNPTLQNILAATNPLCNGYKDTISIYEYGMILNSNIEGAHTFAGGTQQIADLLAKVIEENGGKVIAGAKVAKISISEGVAEYIELSNSERIYAKHIISSIHPANTLSMLDNNNIIKRPFINRIKSLPNSNGIFTMYAVPKENTIKYENRNYYIYDKENVWLEDKDYHDGNIPAYLVCMHPSATSEYVDNISVMIFMPKFLYEEWNETTLGKRDDSYNDFKQKYSERLCKKLYERFPALKENIEEIYTSTPLTYRDYTSTPDGTAYGITKDCRNPMLSHFMSRTKIPNLYLTGQNLNIHGCLGTTLSAAITCSEILGMEYLIKKIGNA